MEVLTLTAKMRQELILYLREFLDEKSMRWARDCMSRINKEVMESNNFEFGLKAYNFYKNFVNFFKTYVKDVEAGNLIYSIYVVSTQLGIETNVEEFKSLEQLQELINIDDFEGVTKLDIDAVDILAEKAIHDCYLYQTESDEIWACGIHTLATIGLYI